MRSLSLRAFALLLALPALTACDGGNDSKGPTGVQDLPEHNEIGGGYSGIATIGNFPYKYSFKIPNTSSGTFTFKGTGAEEAGERRSLPITATGTYTHPKLISNWNFLYPDGRTAGHSFKATVGESRDTLYFDGAFSSDPPFTLRR